MVSSFHYFKAEFAFHVSLRVPIDLESNKCKCAVNANVNNLAQIILLTILICKKTINMAIMSFIDLY